MGLRCSITGRLWVNSALHPPDFLTCMVHGIGRSTCPKIIPRPLDFLKKKSVPKKQVLGGAVVTTYAIIAGVDTGCGPGLTSLGF